MNTGTGTIKALRATFGFITDEASVDYFFHRTDVAGALPFEELKEGDKVTFERVDPAPPQGDRAADVQWQAQDVSS